MQAVLKSPERQELRCVASQLAHFAALMLTFSVLSAPARSQGSDGSYEVGVLGVKLRFAAVDERGERVSDLRPDEVEVHEDGVPQSVKRLSYEHAGISVAVVIDSSESMTYRMDDAISAA